MKTNPHTEDSTSADALKAAVSTSLWAFIGIFGMSLLGWLSEVASWASASGADPFPKTSVLGYALVSAAAAAAAFAVAGAVRYAQTRGWIPGKPPHYEK